MMKSAKCIGVGLKQREHILHKGFTIANHTYRNVLYIYLREKQEDPWKSQQRRNRMTLWSSSSDCEEGWRRKNTDWKSKIGEWRSSWQASWTKHWSWGTTSNGLTVQINYKTSLQAKKCEEELAKRDPHKQLQFERAHLKQKLEFEKRMEEGRKSGPSCGVACSSEKH